MYCKVLEHTGVGFRVWSSKIKFLLTIPFRFQYKISFNFCPALILFFMVIFCSSLVELNKEFHNFKRILGFRSADPAIMLNNKVQFSRITLRSYMNLAGKYCILCVCWPAVFRQKRTFCAS